MKKVTLRRTLLFCFSILIILGVIGAGMVVFMQDISNTRSLEVVTLNNSIQEIDRLQQQAYQANQLAGTFVLNSITDYDDVYRTQFKMAETQVTMSIEHASSAIVMDSSAKWFKIFEADWSDYRLRMLKIMDMTIRDERVQAFTATPFETVLQQLKMISAQMHAQIISDEQQVQEQLKLYSWLGVGLAAILTIVGIVLATWFANWLSRPLLKLRSVAQTITNGDYQVHIDEQLLRRSDELGDLASDLRKMSSKLDETNTELASWNGQLEARVIERTQKVRLILDHVQQGFLSFGNDLVVDEEYSVACVSMLGIDPKGMSVVDLIVLHNPELVSWLPRLFQALFQSTQLIYIEMLIGLIPKELMIGHRVVGMELQAIKSDGERPDKIIMVLTDKTKQRELENKLQEEEKFINMVVSVLSHSREYWDLVNDYKQFVTDELANLIRSNDVDAELMALRVVHTFKGSFAQMNSFKMTTYLHYVEETFSKDPHETKELWHERILNYDWLGALDEEQRRLNEMLTESIWNKQSNSLSIEREALIQLKLHILHSIQGKLAFDLAGQVERLYHKPFMSLFESIFTTAPKMAERLNKVVHPVQILGGDFLMDTEPWYEWSKSLVHILRNQLDHGIEDPDVRGEKGKDISGNILITIEMSEASLSVSFTDDGAGINYTKLREKIVQAGFVSAAQVQLLDEKTLNHYLFYDQISTRDQISELSGRGIGLAKVLEETKKLGGRIEVDSLLGKGTQMKFQFPR